MPAGEDAMVWTACAGLVLDKNTAEHEKPQDSPTGGLSRARLPDTPLRVPTRRA